MFKLVENPTFTAPVTVMVPTDDGHEEQSFRARFRVLPDERLEDVRTTGDHELTKCMLRDAIVELFDVVGANDKPLPHSAELVEDVIDLPFARLGLLGSYFAALHKARLGN